MKRSLAPTLAFVIALLSAGAPVRQAFAQTVGQTGASAGSSGDAAAGVNSVLGNGGLSAPLAISVQPLSLNGVLNLAPVPTPAASVKAAPALPLLVPAAAEGALQPAAKPAKEPGGLPAASKRADALALQAKPVLDGVKNGDATSALAAVYENGAAQDEPGAVRGRSGAAARPLGLAARETVPDSETARRLRAAQNFARTPDYPNSPAFTENSRKANDFFNRWLNGREGGIPLRQALESMHKLYAGDGEIGKGKGGQYMADGMPNNGRGNATRDFVRDYYGLTPNPDGAVSLPGIPQNMSPLFLGARYFYPDSSIPGMRETYYKELETQLRAYTVLVNRIEALKTPDPALVDAALDAVVDFGRTAAAFRQFKNGNWGLYGPMLNSMVNRLGFSIESPGYLDIILQGADAASLKPFFRRALRAGTRFFPSDGWDPIERKRRGSGVISAGSPAIVKYEDPIGLRIGGEYGKALEILSIPDLTKRFPDVAIRIADPTVEYVLIDPADPAQLKGLRPGRAFELGRANPGRFELTPTVSGRHLRITSNGRTLTIEDLGSSNGTRLERALTTPLRPVTLPE